MMTVTSHYILSSIETQRTSLIFIRCLYTNMFSSSLPQISVNAQLYKVLKIKSVFTFKIHDYN